MARLSPQTHRRVLWRSRSGGATLTIERRGPMVLLGINRTASIPKLSRALAKTYHHNDHDASLSAVVVLGYGEPPAMRHPFLRIRGPMNHGRLVALPIRVTP
jgi:hypothetical protein